MSKLVTASGDFSILRRIAKECEGMSLRHENKALQAGLSEAIAPIREQAKVNVPKDSWALYRSLSSRVRSYRNGDYLLGMIGPLRHYEEQGRFLKRRKGQSEREYTRENKGMVRPANYAHLVEFGHYSAAATGLGAVAGTKNTRRRRGNFPVRSFVRPQPFLRSAFELHRSRLQSGLLSESVGKAMQRQLARLNKIR